MRIYRDDKAKRGIEWRVKIGNIWIKLRGLEKRWEIFAQIDAEGE